MSLDLGAVVGRVILETVEFDAAYTRSQAKLRAFGTMAEKSSGGVRVLDRSMLGAAGSADKATASVDRASQSVARKAAADQKAAAAAEKHTVSMTQLRNVMGTVAGESAKVQQATLREAAAQERLTALQESGVASSRQLYLAQANLIGAQRSLAAAQREGAVAGGKFGESMKSGLKLAGSLGLLIGAIEIGKKAVEFVGAGKELTDSLNTVQAVSRATAAQMVGVRAEAIALGKDLKVPGATAVDAADAIMELVKAGIALPRALMAARPALLLASATQTDMADTARVLGDTMDIWSIKGSGAAHTAAILGAAALGASHNLMGLFDAIRQAGPSAQALNVSLDDTATALVYLAKHGLGTEMGGTGLKIMLATLAHDTPRGMKALQDLGVSAWDAQGKFVGFPKLIDQLHGAYIRFGSDSHRLARDFTAAFGSRGMNVAYLLMKATGKEFDELKKHLEAGNLQTFADQMNRGVGAGFRQLNKELTAVGVDVYSKFEPALATAVMWVGTNLPKAVSTAGSILAPFASFVGGALSGAWRLLSVAIGFVGLALTPVVALLEDLKGPLGAGATLVLAMWAAFRLGAAIPAILDAVALRAMYAKDATLALGVSAKATATSFLASSTTIAASADATAAEVSVAGKVAGAGWRAALGPLLAIGVGIGFVVSMFHHSAAASKEATDAAKAYGDVLKTGNGGSDFLDTIVNQLSSNNVPEKIDALNKALGTMAFHGKDFSSALNAAANGSDGPLRNLEARLWAVTRASTFQTGAGNGMGTMIKQNTAQAKAAFALLNDLTAQYTGITKEQAKEISRFAKFNTVAAPVTQVAQALHLGSKELVQYAGMLGLSVTKNNDLVDATKANQLAISAVANDYARATATGTEYLNAVNTFSQSAGTAADRAALIGATLKAANGDALNYAASMNAAASADHQLATDVASAAKAVGKSGISVREFMRSVVQLKTGTIDYSKSGAAPLISDLQSMQSAAMAAASATYQHARATMTGSQAADQAYQVYKNQTEGSLIAQARQLGLTSGEAKKLADRYFGMPKSVKTLIEAQGKDAVVDVLNRIGAMLAKLTGQQWNVGLNVTANYSPGAQRALNLINGRNHQAAIDASRGKATGGLITGPGTGTSDTAGLYALSNHEFVSTARSVVRNHAALEAGNRGAVLAVASAPRAVAAPRTVPQVPIFTAPATVRTSGAGHGYQSHPAASGGGTSHQAGLRPVHIDRFEQTINYPEPEPVSALAPRAMRMASYELGHL